MFSRKRITDWPQSDSVVATTTYRSGDRIRLSPNQGFCNVRLADPTTVRRVELFQYRPPTHKSDPTDVGTQTLIVSLRSQFSDFTKPLELLKGPDDNDSSEIIDSAKNVYPYTESAYPFIVIYTNDDLAPRAKFMIDIVMLPAPPAARTYHYLTLRNHLALNVEDIEQELPLGGPATGLKVRYYGKGGVDDTSVKSVSLRIGGDILSLKKLPDHQVWSVELDGSRSLGANKAKLLTIGASGVVGARVEQTQIGLLRFSDYARFE